MTVISYTCWEIYTGRVPSTDRPCGIYVYLEKYLDFCHGFASCIHWQSHSSGKDLCWQRKLGHSDTTPLGMPENLQNCWRILAACNLEGTPYTWGCVFKCRLYPDHLSQHGATSHAPVSSTWLGLVRPLSTGKQKDLALSIKKYFTWQNSTVETLWTILYPKRWLENLSRPLLWQDTCFLLQPVPTLRPIDNILEANQNRLTFLKAWAKKVTFSSGIWRHISIGFKAAISTGPSKWPDTCVPKTWEL